MGAKSHEKAKNVSIIGKTTKKIGKDLKHSIIGQYEPPCNDISCVYIASRVQNPYSITLL